MTDPLNLTDFENLVSLLIDGERVPYSPAKAIEDFGDDAPAMILEAVKYDALDGIKRDYGALLVRLLGNPTREERDTWERQRDWAIRHQAGDQTATALLTGLLTDSEIAEHGANGATYMANVVLGKNAVAENLISVSGRIRRTAEGAIDGATTAAEIDAALAAARQSFSELVTPTQG